MESVTYPASHVERVMKVQEVILRAIDGRLKWYEAAEILGISDRQMRRFRITGTPYLILECSTSSGRMINRKPKEGRRPDGLRFRTC
jgi:hypothetical protein